jgi:capsular polysaccharide biosynthesis protein
MNSVQPPDSYDSADYSGVLRRRWPIVLGLTCLGLVGAFAYATVAPKSYSATAAVNVTPTAADQNNSVQGSRTNGATVNLDTEAQIVVSTAVATIAAHMLHSTATPSALAKHVSVTVPPNSSVLDIACSASSGAGAATCATDFARAYLQNRSATATNFINAKIHTLKSQLTPAQATQSTLSNKIPTLSKNSSKKLAAQTQLKQIKGQVHALQSEINSLTGQLANNQGGSLITTPQVPTSPSSPRKSLVLPGGLVLGLVIGLIAAFVVDRRDKRIHGAADVERVLDLPVVLSLPDAAFSRPVSLASPRSKTGQAFTELAHSAAAALGDQNNILLVAGTAPGAGTSVIAANLAATLARTHSAAVLVCANLNDTVTPELLGVSGHGEGLAELVAGAATTREVVQAPAAVPGLWVITPGADPSLAVYNFQYDTARALISQLRRDARFVVIEVQSTDDGADTFALGEFADAALIAVENNRTTKPTALACIRRLRQLHTPIMGAVTYPAIGTRVSVRPPRQPQQRLAAAAGGPGRDSLEADHGSGPLSPSGSSAGGPERRGRSVRTRNGYSDRADRVSGS